MQRYRKPFRTGRDHSRYQNPASDAYDYKHAMNVNILISATQNG